MLLQVTGRVQWVLPPQPHTLELDDSGSKMFVEPQQDRVMPSRSTLLAGVNSPRSPLPPPLLPPPLQ